MIGNEKLKEEASEHKGGTVGVTGLSQGTEIGIEELWFKV